MSARALRLHERLQRIVPGSPADIPTRDAERTQLIDAYWDDVEERVLYVMVLLSAGRNNEAMTLCAAYLEGVAHELVAMHPSTGEAFEDEAEQLSSDPYLTLVHPMQIVRVVAVTEGLSPTARLDIAQTFPGPEHTLLHKEQALEIVRALVEPAEAALLERVIWKCTIAYVIYDFIRSQSFKRREGTRTIGLGTAFHEGHPVHELSVPELVSLLRGMVAEARDRAHASGTLPQHD